MNLPITYTFSFKKGQHVCTSILRSFGLHCKYLSLSEGVSHEVRGVR